MDSERAFRTTRSGAHTVELYVFPDADISEPETVSEDEDLLDLVPDESATSDDSSEDDLPELQWKWIKRDLSVQDISHERRFKSEERTVSENGSPLMYFKKYFTDEMFQYIADQSTTYAVKNNNLRVHFSRYDIELFVGTLLKMGIIPMPRYRMYWSADFRVDSIANRLTRNRFMETMRYLHFNDNSQTILDRDDPNYDRLCKIRPLLEMFRKCCRETKNEEMQCVDEQIIPYKGKHKLKQYLPCKPQKWGFKIISRAGKSGLLYDFVFYDVKNPIVEDPLPFQPANYVLKLCETLQKNRNYKLFFDDYYTFLELQLRLKEMGILSCGTIRANRLRGCPMLFEKDLKSKGRGAYDFRTDAKKEIIAVAWYDNRRVTATSTYLGIKPKSTMKRWDGRQQKVINVDVVDNNDKEQGEEGSKRERESRVSK
ncbi:PiggyBac transposable element-derived protein 3 [Trichinella nativa]|uniref:PiggyBac transposable element-derived protein 3 n=1 Tax=Trichinella nativa TaxID=6335 RepID=A0A0V1KXM6_9BILA|nr:PiggyBac transposable element-derived protein 3 [Trichinella nativa]